MLLLFYALPPITAYPDAPIQPEVVAFVEDEDDDVIALLAHFEYF